MKRVNLLLAFLFTMGMFTVYAQTTINGTVLDANGEAVPGANIRAKGYSDVGTISDLNGSYTLSVPAEATTLIFSFVGMQTQEIEIGGQTTINITLQNEDVGIDEVVVVAYGTQRKRDVTGAISTLSTKDMEDISVVSFENAIQGKSAGVTINSGARSGNVSAIRIRGTSSITASSQPLYVIDGMIQGDYIMGYTGDNSQHSPLSNLDPNDIESIQVLKDASASALYGSRASNGVILITTKRGKSGKTRINVNLSTGFQEATNFVKMLDGYQFTELFNESYNNTFGDPEILDPNDVVSTSWLDETQRRGYMKDFSLSANGGNEKTTFYTGLSYKDEEGYSIGNNYQRVAGRLNLDHKASEKLNFSSNISFSRVLNDRVSGSNSVSSSSTLSLLQFPNIPVYGDGSDLYGPEGSYYYGNGVNPFGAFGTHNMVADAEQSYHRSVITKPSVEFTAAYEFIDGLKAKANIGLEYIDMADAIFWSLYSIDGAGSQGGGQALNYRRINWMNTFTLEYAKTFAETHNLNAFAGYSFQQLRMDASNTSGEQFPNNDLNTLNSAGEITNGGGSVSNVAYESYFARANYDYLGKYLIQVSFRRDGSSRFGANNRYANFPSVSAGWMLSDEAFMESIGWLSQLKVRSSYGLTGNSEILSSSTASNATVQNFASLGLYGSGNNYGGLPGISATQLPNPDLKWEQTAQFDIGLNLGFLNDRIQIEADYYIKKTTDLLLNVPLPRTSGFLSTLQNFGELENKGYELSLTTRNFVGKFVWTTTFNMGHNENLITKLESPITNTPSRVEEGHPIGAFYLVEYAGVNPDNGDAQFYDLDGNIVSNAEYSTDYRKWIGDPNPDFVGGLTNTFSFKGFDLNVFFQFVQGVDIYEDGGRFSETSQGSIFNQNVTQLNRWQNPDDITDVPQARLFGGNGNQHSTRYLREASYIRMKTLAFGYNLPKNLLSKMKMEKLRLYVALQNYLTFTEYEGNDPEVGSNGITNVGQGQTFMEAPTPKIVTFGINIGL